LFLLQAIQATPGEVLVLNSARVTMANISGGTVVAFSQVERKLSLIVFFWPVQNTWYSLDDLLKHAQRTSNSR